MKGMSIINSFQFNDVNCDFFRGEDGEPYMTRRQLGTALGYLHPVEAIKDIHMRHRARMDKHSRVAQIALPSGGTQNTTLYSPKGIMEVCRHSDQPVADDFMDWVWDVIDTIRKTGAYGQPTMPETSTADPALEREKLNIQKAEIFSRMVGMGRGEEFNLFCAMWIADFLSGDCPRLPNSRELQLLTYPLPELKPVLDESKALYTREEIAALCNSTPNDIGHYAVQAGMVAGNCHTPHNTVYTEWDESKKGNWFFTRAGAYRVMEIVQRRRQEIRSKELCIEGVRFRAVD